MANSGIGAMGRGLNMKMVYDPTTGAYVPVPAGPLTNPLYAGWTTAFVRTVLTEVMTYYHEQGYSVKSCTTDGFIVERGEMLPHSTNFGIFSRMYQTGLRNLGIDKYFLEVKHADVGLMS